MKLESRLELEQHQWHPAESTLEKLAATTIPASGRLTRREAHLVAQLAGAASEANDAPELAALRAQYKGRFPPGTGCRSCSRRSPCPPWIPGPAYLPR